MNRTNSEKIIRNLVWLEPELSDVKYGKQVREIAKVLAITFANVESLMTLVTTGDSAKFMETLSQYQRNKITELLRQRRMALGLTQAQLAVEIGLKSGDSVYKFENNIRTWSLKHLLKACEILDLRLEIHEKS